MNDTIKNVIIAILFVIGLILAEAIGTLIDQKEQIEIKLQSEIEKSSDLEMVLDDKLLKDYLWHNDTKSAAGASNSID